MRFVLIFILYISCYSFSTAQDLNGIWTGTSVQVVEGKTVVFDYEIIITQTGKRITAKFYSKEAGTENYFIVVRKGTFKKGVVKLHVDEISKIDFPDPTFPLLLFRALKGDLTIDTTTNTMVIEGVSYGSGHKYSLLLKRYVDSGPTFKQGRFYITKRTSLPNHLKEDGEQASNLSEQGALQDEIVVQAKKKIQISSEKVTLKLWDADREDGDVIDLYLNGHILYGDVKVTRAGKIFDLKLRKGNNIIEIEAKNEGNVSPNTSAVTIKVGDEEYEVTLSALKGKRDQIQIFVD